MPAPKSLFTKLLTRPTGPGDVFPDFSAGADYALGKAWFWVALAFQIFVCLGFLKFFRNEQLNKP
jgi:alpha-1,3-glucan synthase